VNIATDIRNHDGADGGDGDDDEEKVKTTKQRSRKQNHLRRRKIALCVYKDALRTVITTTTTTTSPSLSPSQHHRIASLRIIHPSFGRLLQLHHIATPSPSPHHHSIAFFRLHLHLHLRPRLTSPSRPSLSPAPSHPAFSASSRAVVRIARIASDTTPITRHQLV
jgi:hypothetical protein